MLVQYTVYCHVFPNGKRYIGLTRTEAEKRWGNGKNYKTCLLVDRAIKKYGWENIEHVILCTADTKEKAEELERHYISLYKSDDAKYGYNILPGGDVATNDANDEMRYKLGNGWRGKHRTDGEKEKISKGVKERFKRPESNGHFGLKASEKTKKKMSESHKRRWETDSSLREEAKERMKERMRDPEFKNKVISSLVAATKRAKGTRKMSEATKKKISEFNKGRYTGEKSPTSKPVLQYDLDGTFIKRWASAGEAERAGIALKGNISKVCNHYRSWYTAGGYVWRFENDKP